MEGRRSEGYAVRTGLRNAETAADERIAETSRSLKRALRFSTADQGIPVGGRTVESALVEVHSSRRLPPPGIVRLGWACVVEGAVSSREWLPRTSRRAMQERIP